MTPIRPPIIGLSGGIGSGKSEVARILRRLGCVVVNSDELSHEALRDPAIHDTLIQWWGRSILDSQGLVDRSAVAKIVFNDRAQRQRLERLTHPWIEARRKEIFDAAPPSPATPALVIDAPLLFEAGIDGQCDAVWFVDATRERRLARVMAQRGWDEAEVARRESSQMPLDEKRRRADDVLINAGDLDALTARVKDALIRITQSRRF